MLTVLIADVSGACARHAHDVTGRASTQDVLKKRSVARSEGGVCARGKIRHGRRDVRLVASAEWFSMIRPNGELFEVSTRPTSTSDFAKATSRRQEEYDILA